MNDTESNKEDGREKAQKSQKETSVFEPLVPFRGNCLAQSGSTQPAHRSLCGEGGSRLVTVIFGMAAQRLIGIQDVEGSQKEKCSSYFHLIPHTSAFEGWNRRLACPSRPLAGWRDRGPHSWNRFRERRFSCTLRPLAEASGGTPAATGREACSTDKFPAAARRIPTNSD